MPNESYNGLTKRSVAAARLDDPDSADTQFFINVENNDFLDAKPNKPGYGYSDDDGWLRHHRTDRAQRYTLHGVWLACQKPIIILVSLRPNLDNTTVIVAPTAN